MPKRKQMHWLPLLWVVVGIVLFGAFILFAWPHLSLQLPAVVGPQVPIIAVPPDKTPPIISRINIPDRTAETVTLTWSTNEEATTEVITIQETATGAPAGRWLGDIDDSTIRSRNHTAIIINLDSNTGYTITIQSKDAAGNIAQRNRQVTTAADPLRINPYLGALRVVPEGNDPYHTLLVTFRTNYKTFARAECKDQVLGKTTTGSDMEQRRFYHEIVISDLFVGATHDCTVEAHTDDPREITSGSQPGTTRKLAILTARAITKDDSALLRVNTNTAAQVDATIEGIDQTFRDSSLNSVDKVYEITIDGLQSKTTYTATIEARENPEAPAARRATRDITFTTR